MTATGTTTPQPRRQPWLHRLEIATCGNTTALSAPDGTIDAGSPGLEATGLFVDDRRILSTLRTTVDGEAPVVVACDSVAETSSFLLLARNVGDPGPDPTVELRRRRVLSSSTLREELRVTSRAATDVDLVVEVRLAGDGAELHQVKSGGEGAGTIAARRGPAGTAEWEDDRHAVTVRAPEAEVRADSSGAVVRWPVHLVPGGSEVLAVRVSARRLVETPFDADAGGHLLDWSGVEVGSRDPRLAATVRRGVRDLRSLVLQDPDAPGDVFAAAGTPWYLTLFGRDSIWAARMSLPWGTELAGGTLRALARRQGRRDDVPSAEERGKILHEVRRTAFDDPGHLHLPPTYYGTVDATPLWVCLLHDAWRWGLAGEQVLDLEPALSLALEWMDRAVTASPDGFLRYHDASGTGLSNQGWKDSGDAMRRADGTIAEGPIALLETQAYAVEAALGAARLLEEVHQRDGASWRRWAEDLSARVRSAFWVGPDEDRYPAMALDGDGAPVDGVGSNMGHALGTGLFDTAETSRVAAVLTSPRMMSRFGIRTLSADNPAYNPVGYHTGSVWTHDTAICAQRLADVGEVEGAGTVVSALLTTAETSGYRWPELCGAEPLGSRPVPYPASCRPQAWAAASAGVLITTLLGLDADVPGGTLRVRPLRPSPVGALSVTGLRVGSGGLAVSVDDSGEVTEVRVDDPAVRVVVDPV